MDTIEIMQYPSPAGMLILGACGDRLCLCDWATSARHAANIRRACRCLDAVCRQGTPAIVRHAAAMLDEYFAGQRTTFDIPMAFTGSPFQQLVWDSLTGIPYGATITYGNLAARIGRPTATRAVATAVASNPLSIIVPCHRVVASGRRPTGYAGGPEARRWLMHLEQNHTESHGYDAGETPDYRQ